MGSLRVLGQESQRHQGVVGILRRGKLPCKIYFRYFFLKAEMLILIVLL